MATICIDGFNLAMPKGTGIATYGRNLLSNLQAIDLNTQVLYASAGTRSTSDLVNETTIADGGGALRKAGKTEQWIRALSTRKGIKAYPVPHTGKVVWPEQFGGRPNTDSYWIARDLFRSANRSFKLLGQQTELVFSPTNVGPRPDAMHWTALLPLHARDVPNIYTIHDLVPLKLPHSTTDDKDRYLSLCRLIVENADHIAVVSEATRRDVIEILGVDEKRITNTYQAIHISDALLARTNDEVSRELEGVFGLGWKSYFVHFGAIEPKKNLGRIVEGYLSSGVQTPLIIVGGRSWRDATETALLDQILRDAGSAAERIRRYDFLSISLLTSLMRGAKAMIFPSLYEGFGLPVLEAMALGTAVLTSTAGSLPEISGDAAITLDPYDVQAITNAIISLDCDQPLREELESRGRKQAALFSPEAYQMRLRGLYSQIGLS